MRLRFFYLLLVCLFPIIDCAAQFNESIVSDRPGQTNSPYTVGKKVLQFQTGPQLDGSSADNISGSAFSWPMFIRFGITDKIEVQTLWTYQNENADQSGTPNGRSGLSAADFGIRFNIFEESEKVPALGFEVLYNTKIRSSDYKPQYPSAKLNMMATKSISDLFSLNANLGVDFDGNGGAPTGLYTLNLVLAVNEALSVFFENYGNFNSNSFNTFFDFGGAYILNPDVQLDLYGGFGYNNNTFSYLVSGGVSYRIVKWR